MLSSHGHKFTGAGTKLDERIQSADRNLQDAFPNIFTFLVCVLS
jgi:hypothetical protein